MSAKLILRSMLLSDHFMVTTSDFSKRNDDHAFKTKFKKSELSPGSFLVHWLHFKWLRKMNSMSNLQDFPHSTLLFIMIKRLVSFSSILLWESLQSLQQDKIKTSPKTTTKNTISIIHTFLLAEANCFWKAICYLRRTTFESPP